MVKDINKKSKEKEQKVKHLLEVLKATRSADAIFAICNLASSNKINL
jgi:hypothetical protein